MQREKHAISTANSPAAVDAERIYDLQAALLRLDGDHELFRKLVEFFSEDYPRLLERLQAGIVARQSAEVERAAHSLKGLSAAFSAHSAAGAALQMEELGRAGDLPAAAQALPVLQQQLQRLRVALSAYLADSNS